YTKETTETAEEFIHIIEVLTRLNGVEVEICGSWVWVSGNTKEHREILKQLNFKWANKKRAWYYHTEPFRKKSKRELTLDEIREMFGSQSYKHKEEKQLALQG
ncbi:MAG: molecular chaperone DnaJ, partial [Ruminococcus sp.]|nr:molecular chaperone DnaJ [Ruminococcus sp.]